MNIRFANQNDLDSVNALRKQVSSLHAAGKPEVFKPEFSQEVRDFLFQIWNDPEQEIVVAERDCQVCGYAVLHHIIRPENPAKWEQDFLDIDEFGVDEACRRQGLATEMIAFIREFAAQKGYSRIELNMWEFNKEALAFYEAVGFVTFRRFMEMTL